MNPRGSVTTAALHGTGLAGLAAVTGAAAMNLVQASGTTVDVLVTAGIVVTLLLLMLGKMVANERTMGKLEGRVEENSKRDDMQDRTLAELWAEARGMPERIRQAKHDAVNTVSGQVGELQERQDGRITVLEARLRDLELTKAKGA